MADNRYRRYLEPRPSSRFLQREYDAESDKRNKIGNVAIGVGVGAVLVGALAHSGALSDAISHLAGRASQYQGTSVRSVVEGVREWAKHPADLHHGTRMMLRGQFSEGSEALRRSAQAMRASVDEARDRLTREASERLRGMPSGFEDEFARLLRNRETNQMLASGHARRQLATDLIDSHMMPRATSEQHAEALSRISLAMSEMRPAAMQGLTRDTFMGHMERSLGLDFNDAAAAEVWEGVMRSYVLRDEAVDGVVRPLFVNAQERAAIRTARERGQQLNPLLEALRNAEQSYHRMSVDNFSRDYEVFAERLAIDPQADAALQRMTGLRQATVEDLLERGELGSVIVQRAAAPGQELQQTVDVEALLRDSQRKRVQDMKQLSAGRGLYMNRDNELVDLRAWQTSATGVMDFIAYETQLPLVKFNPLQLLHYGSLRQTGELADTHWIPAGSLQYNIRGTADRDMARSTQDLILRDGKVYDFASGELIRGDSEWYAASNRYATLANMVSEMVGPRHVPPRPTGALGGALYDIGQWLDIGNQSMPSAFKKIGSIFTKFDDPNWAGNNINAILEGISQPDELLDFDRRLARLSEFARYNTTAFSDDAFQAIVHSSAESAEVYERLFAQYDLSDTEHIMDAMSQLIQDRTTGTGTRAGDLLSNQYRPEIIGQWNRYIRDPEAFMRAVYPQDNKAPVKLLSATNLESQPSRMKRLLQNEILASIQRETETPLDISGAVQAAYESGIISAGEVRNARFSSLTFMADAVRMSTSTETPEQTVTRINAFIETNRELLTEFAAHKAPKWQFGPFGTPTRQLAFSGGFEDDTVNTGVMLMQRARRFPARVMLSAIGGDTDAQQQFRQGTSAFFRQFGAGRENMGDVTTATLFPYFFVQRLSSALDNFGLGLGPEHLGSTGDVVKGLIGKRYMPAYALLALGGGGILGYLNWELGNVFGTRPSEFGAKMLKQAHLDIAGARDAMGITAAGKRAERYMPGSEMIWEIPGLSALDPTESREDLEEHYAYGTEPVRKGRYWPLGNTPYVGGKVMYYQPNWYQRAMHDVAHTDVLYGSGEEHYSHVPFPTFRNPLAPLNYIFDPYHYEQKHYWDRPYPVTSGVSELEDFPIIGTTLNETVGQLIKPRRYMHTEELPPPYGTAVAGDIVRNINEYEKARAQDKQAYAKIMPSGDVQPVEWQLAQGIRSKRMPTKTQLRQYLNEAPVSDSGRADGRHMVADINRHEKERASAKGVEGSSDLPQYYLIDADQTTQYMPRATYYLNDGYESAGRQHVAAINAETKRRGAPKRGSQMPAGDLVPIPMYDSDDNMGSSTELPEGLLTPSDIRYQLGKTYYGLTQMGGIYGFGTTLALGEPYSDRPVMASSTRMTTAERAFYDQEIGGIGGDLSEIGRRFLPHRQRQQELYNPIRNTMPDWMPGEDYLHDFRHGDPYASVPKGEMRLPGAGYELMHDVPGVHLRMAASTLGSDVDEMVTYLTKQKEPLSEYGKYVTDIGDKFHSYYQNLWRRRGILRKENIEREVYDKQHNIKGYIDAILDTPEGPEIADIKSMSAKRFKKAMKSGKPYREHVEQVNFYMHATGIRRGGLMYVSRDDPTQEAYFQIEYSDKMFRKSLKRLEEARGIVRDMIKRGEVNKFDLYDDLNRFRILADVAPWSAQYKHYAAKVAKDERLTERERKEVKAIKKQVSEVKKRRRFFPYQFTNADIERQSVVIDEVLDNQRFTAKGYPDEVFSLAGISVPTGESNELAADAHDVISRTIRPGRRVQIGIDSDKLYQHKSDVMRSIPAVVYDTRGRKLNRQLIDMGLASEKETDITPAGVHARFTDAEITKGRMWERFAHLDTPIHTKFLQVRSPLEDYERREVYGKNWQTWDHPIRDFIRPTTESFARHNPLVSVLLGAALGSMFGRGRSKWVTAGIGAAIAGGASLMRVAHEGATGDTWVPKRRELERDIDEYFDILKYVKAKGLYEYSLRQAEEHDKENPKDKFRRIEQFGRYRKYRTRQLQREKRELMRDGRRKNKEQIDDINQQLKSISSYRGIAAMNPWEMQALHYKRQMETTLYGADPHGSTRDFITALPKKDREYATAFLKHSSPEERKRILELVPRNQRPFYQARWGEEVDEKPDLKEYFKKRFLPPPDWEGWQPDKSLDDVKIKVIRNEGAEMAEFGFWPQDVRRAEENEAPALPIFNAQVQGFKIKQMLETTLKGEGLRDINIVVLPANASGIQVDFDLEQDREDELEEYARKHSARLL